MRDGKLIFILGGARSGKSKFAEELGKSFNQDVVYIATFPENGDKEMIERIKIHKKMRPRKWKTLEIGDIDKIILKIKKNKIKNSIIIIECLTILVSNLLVNDKTDKIMINKINNIINNIQKLIDFIKNNNTGNIYIIVSNEVGQGIVPENELARKYRDILGKVNQKMAKNADEFYMMFAGIPIEIKKSKLK